MAFELLPWQVEPTRRLTEILSNGPVALNTSETGVGKTYMAAAALKALGRRPLVICPKSVITAWQRVLDSARVEPFDVLNWEKLKTGKRAWYSKDAWHLQPGAVVIVDEVHRGASGPESQTTEVLAKLRAYLSGVSVLMQSATIADTPLKMRALGYMCGLHTFSMPAFNDWCLRSGCQRVLKNVGYGRKAWKMIFPGGAKGKELMRNIHLQLAPIMVRVRAADAPGFPDNEVLANLYDLEAGHTELYNKIMQEMREELKRPKADPMVAMLRARQQTELLKIPVLTELTNDLLEEDKSVVLFVNFHETMGMLKLALPRDLVEIHGRQSSAERAAAIDAFQDNTARICLAQTQAGGVGVSLHDVHGTRPRVSLITPSWSASDIVQCLGRIRRAGGTKAVQIFVLAAGTIEEKIHAAISRKLGNIDALNDGDLSLEE